MVDIHASEEEQIQAIKKWIADYGLFVVLGLVFGLGSVFGWRAYTDYKTGIARSASTQYEEMRTTAQLGDIASARAKAEAIIAEFGGTPYATQSALYLANLEIDDAQPEVAIAHLQSVIDGSAEVALKHVARLRIARTQLYILENSAEAMATLEVANEGEFSALYAELRGDVFVEQGNTGSARAEYEAALAAWTADMGSNHFIKMKLEDLAPVTETSQAS